MDIDDTTTTGERNLGGLEGDLNELRGSGSGTRSYLQVWGCCSWHLMGMFKVLEAICKTPAAPQVSLYVSGFPI